MRMILVILCALLLGACAEISQGVESAQQAVETGKQVVEQGKQIAESEVAKQLQAYLQQKYESSESLRKAMFSGDGQVLADELKKTELANFSFYRSDLFGVEFSGTLTGDGTFRVLRHSLKNPNEEPVVVKEFKVTLDKSGQIQVQ